MSKPLATKVSTPLSKNVQIGPKVSYFVWPPLFSSTALILLGVHQSFTGCHWSPLPLLHDNFTELVDVRDLALLHLPFEDAHRSPLSSASLARQGSSWRCVWVRYHVGLRPRFRREGIMLCFSMSPYMLTFMVPSMSCSSPVTAALMQPQTMTLPLPCLTVGKTHLSLNSLPGYHHTCFTPSEPHKFILVSSDHRKWFQ